MDSLNELNFRANLIGTLLKLYKKYKESGQDQEFSLERCIVKYTSETGLEVSVPKAKIIVTDYRYDTVQLAPSIRNAGDIPYFWLERLAEGDLIAGS
ncbi:hypothetical protein [Aneurinibacillus tyrosinisolvens]|uniref:hypothetical protein n=1 Tax=Aneurinibacillus tyrosinisolvens TaxID=1443435 RepID=UPI00063EF71D|nr:hypothetical protein [Aneurinibacillus tyrosinisolvens]